MGNFPFAGTLDDTKSDIPRIAAAERARQWRRLIMIPSESICHPATGLRDWNPAETLDTRDSVKYNCTYEDRG
jgi:hypothetical protein